MRSLSNVPVFVNSLGVLSDGYGIVPKKVMMDTRLSATSKAIFAYICCMSGGGISQIGLINDVISNLNITEQTYNKHMYPLIRLGYLKIDTYETNFEVTIFLDLNTNNEISKTKPDNNLLDYFQNDYDHEVETLIDFIKEQIDYNSFKICRPYDLNFIDEIIDIILDVIMSNEQYIKVNNEKKSLSLVKSIFKKLGYSEIELVIDNFKKITEVITSKKTYIITMLYNAKLEINSHYSNQVNSDMYGDK